MDVCRSILENFHFDLVTVRLVFDVIGFHLAQVSQELVARYRRPALHLHLQLENFAPVLPSIHVVNVPQHRALNMPQHFFLLGQRLQAAQKTVVGVPALG
jgi:hypothetical protein